MNKSNLEGKTLSVVLWGTDKNGEDEVFICKSEFKKQDDKYSFEISSNVYEKDSAKITLSLSNDFLDRLKTVTEDMKETLLHTDYSLSLSIGNLPEKE